jgi:hypothetical protein
MSTYVRYLCLPDWQRRCICTLTDTIAGRDCAIEDQPKATEIAPPARPRRGEAGGRS